MDLSWKSGAAWCDLENNHAQCNGHDSCPCNVCVATRDSLSCTPPGSGRQDDELDDVPFSKEDSQLVTVAFKEKYDWHLPAKRMLGASLLVKIRRQFLNIAVTLMSVCCKEYTSYNRKLATETVYLQPEQRHEH